jgi:hypothetical protein
MELIKAPEGLDYKNLEDPKIMDKGKSKKRDTDSRPNKKPNRKLSITLNQKTIINMIKKTISTMMIKTFMTKFKTMVKTMMKTRKQIKSLAEILEKIALTKATCSETRRNYRLNTF